MAAKPQQSGSQPLPGKEGTLFRTLVEQYEEKRYKKAIKTAELILKKFPDHGETLAMKGLTLSNMSPDKKEEAYELVRRGLKADLKSHVCWHVYGLLYRQDHDYKEAIKSYQCALRIDKDNVQILRDLAMLQVQIRDLDGFVDTRNKLLVLKPQQRNNWIAFALAHHANKNYDLAVQVLERYEGTQTEVAPNEAYEHSELLLYKALVLDEAGKLVEALHVLDSCKDKIRDRVGMLEMRASLLLRAGRLSEAEAQYRALLAMNPDHYKWHEGLQAAAGLRAAAGQALTPEQCTKLQQTYSALAGMYPSSTACRRIPLDFLQGEAFVAAADAYVRKYLRKGIPSLFMDVRPLYSDPAKSAALERLFEEYVSALTATSCLPPLKAAPADAPSAPSCNGHSSSPHASDSPSSASGSDADSDAASTSGRQEDGEPAGKAASSVGREKAPLDSPQTLVWVLYYLALHHDRLGRTSKGIQLLEQALAHTPTLIELHTARSKLLRHAGDLLGAAQAAEVARRADLSDRYLNSMAVKALLRADKVDAAEKTAVLFTKDGDGVQGGLTALFDMQHMWFECAAGAAHLRRKEYGKALKRLTTTLKHFDDILEDQFDFHSYCVRKMTLRAYVAMLRMEDQLLGHPFYAKAAGMTIQAYLALHAAPSAAQKEADEEALLAGMTAEERKKYKQQKKKEEKARAKEAEEAAAAASAKASADKPAGGGKKAQAVAGDKKEKDPDPEGALLAAIPDPLGAAAKLAASLKQHAAEDLSTHLLAAEVYGRRGRMLLALAAVQRASALAGAQHPDVHMALVTLCQRVSQPPAADVPATHATVTSLISEGLAQLLAGCPDVVAYNTSWLAQHASQSLAHALSGARALLLLAAPGAAQSAAQLITHISPSNDSSCTHELCVDALALLQGLAGQDAAVSQWRTACAAHFEYSRVLGGSSCVALDPELVFDKLTEAFGKITFA